MADAYPPVTPQPPQPPRGGAGMAIAALVLGIVSLLLFCIPYVSIPCAILAVVLGFVARGRAARGQAEGRGMATAGLVLGAVAVLLGVLFIAGALAFVGFLSNNPEFRKSMEEMQQRMEEQRQRIETMPATEPSAAAPLDLDAGWRI